MEENNKSMEEKVDILVGALREIIALPSKK